MKKVLFIAGIICVVICVLSLLFAALSMHGYYNLMDGSQELYASLHRRMIIAFITGVVFAVIGAACFIIKS